MKPTIQKLVLRKEAIRTLAHTELQQAIGGASPGDAGAVVFESGKACPAPNIAPTFHGG
jgi:hypothetical protein